MARKHTSRPWSGAELATLRTAYEQGATGRELAQLFPQRTAESVRMKVQLERENGLVRVVARRANQPVTTVVVTPHADATGPLGLPLATVLAPEAAQDEPEGAFLDRVLAAAKTRTDRARTQRFATVQVATDQPIALSLSSDWHLGTGADLPGLIRYADWVAHTPGVVAIAVGDLTDNPIKHRGGSVAAVKDELRLLDHLVGRFKGRLLGITSGNHDDWSKTLAGVDNLAALARRHRLHYAPDELLWTVELVDPTDPGRVTATYRVYTRHQWRRSSMLNPGHACWTWWQEDGPNWSHRPDVLAIGHHHVAVVEQRVFADQPPVWALRMGAWQVDSDFARAKGFGRYAATAPTVVLWPHRERDPLAFSDYREAGTYLAGVRA